MRGVPPCRRYGTRRVRLLARLRKSSARCYFDRTDPASCGTGRPTAHRVRTTRAAMRPARTIRWPQPKFLWRQAPSCSRDALEQVSAISSAMESLVASWPRIEPASSVVLCFARSLPGARLTDSDSFGHVVSPSEPACVSAPDLWTFRSAEVCQSGRASSHRENRFLSGGSGFVGAFSSPPLDPRRRAI